MTTKLVSCEQYSKNVLTPDQERLTAKEAMAHPFFDPVRANERARILPADAGVS